MTKNATASKLFALAGLGFVMTVLTGIMGAPFLRVLHKSFGSLRYWVAGIVSVAVFVSGQAIFPASLVAATWLLMGIYWEMEKRGTGWKLAGFISLLVSTAVLVIGTIAAFRVYDITTWDRYVGVINEAIQSVQRVSPEFKVDAKLIAAMMPSFLVSMLIMTLEIGLILERMVARAYRLPYVQIASGLKLLELKLPDSVVWAFLLSLLFSMVNFGNYTIASVALNLVIIGAVLFALQGMAVMEVYFRVMKTGSFIRVSTYILIILVGYLFVLLSALGLIDYWVDFRARLRKVPTSPNADRLKNN
jgi:hypothetical protein